ncbi:MAG TPA: type VI secretion system accessory protein TagJ [Candidatus Acidoferrales bacterium]|nr:type VI secretion system accessory protein TagJ [Candidatus Acidoferrales bacterium]
MTPQELFKAGKLSEAIGALNEELRRNPADTKARTFLFELLCFSGEYDRAEKQLAVLSQPGKQSELGALLYRGALSATRAREDLFQKKEFPKLVSQDGHDGSVSGILNGKPFQTLVDVDPRIGANLEVFVAGNYFWIPFSFLSSIEISPPKRLRDLLWIPAIIRTSPAYHDKELGETLLPALTPFSGTHTDDYVRLGRETSWEEDENGQSYPVGQKLLLADDEEVPILEVRKLEFTTRAEVS